MRTAVYHELLISYLDYVRGKGYNTAHIWACPPLKGDDYILFAKPEDQKTPKDDRLRQWYIDMLKDCQRRGIVGKVTNAYDLYFSENDKYDASVLPYMEGDYFPAELENIIKDLEEGKNLSKKPDKSSSKKGKKEKKSKTKKAGSRGGTRSAGLDEDALVASGILQEGVDTKSIEAGGRDAVMKKLGETIHPMKESFLVAFLDSDCQKEENKVVPPDVMEYRKLHGIGVPKICVDPQKKEGKEAAPTSEAITLPAIKEESSNKEQEATSVEMAKSTIAEPSANEEGEAATVVKEEPKDPPAVKEEPTEKSTEEPSAVKEEPTQEYTQEPSAVEVEATEPLPTDKDATTEEEKKEESPKNEPDAIKEEPSDTPSDTVEDSAAVNEETTVKPAGVDEGAGTEPTPTETSTSTGDKKKEEELQSENTATDKSVANESESAVKEDVAKSDEQQGENPTKADSGETENGTKSQNGDVDMRNATDESGMAEQENNEGDEEKADNNDVEMKESGELATAPTDSETNEDIAPSKDVAPKEAKSANSKDEASASEESKKEDAKSPEVKREGKFAAMEKKLKDKQGDQPEPEKSSSSSDQAASEKKSLTKDSKGRLVKVIDDDDEELDCEFLNNRQLFLNLCQGNHYQFDQLRRAKHTSMMVLWHLHNRDAPKFVQQCAVCSREILQGMRYHCPTCADYDQCYECMSNPNVPRHQHPLKAIPVGNTQATLTPEQRKERQRSIQLHMTLLLHAATCKSSKCASANCAKMKGLLKHGSQCQIKAAGGCHVCKRIWALLQIHARQCKLENCVVPNCLAIRERFRQLNLQQQAMDDRRRQMMNQTYHQQAR